MLDREAVILHGSETFLSFAWDTKLPENVDHGVWNTSLFAKPSDTPKATGTFSGMTPVLVQREVLATLCPL